MKRCLLILLFFFIGANTFAQDQFVGKWEMTVLSTSTPPITMTLKIGDPEKRILYPASLTIQCDSFTANYHLLLVKKNIRQLGISRNKKVIAEMPFSIGNWTVYLNGIFDISKDLRGNSLLTINRITTNDYVVAMPEITQFTPTQIPTATFLKSFLKDSVIQLHQISKMPWKDSATDAIVSFQMNATYFGIVESIHLRTKEGIIKFNENKDNDIVSIFLNSINIFDEVDSRKKRPAEEFLLDTGLNIITFFADDYGIKGTSTASVNLEFDNKIIPLDFKFINNIASTFIVAKIYCDYDESDNTRFKDYSINDRDQSNSVNTTGNLPNENKLLRNNKTVGSILSTSQHITLAIWDDAIEDGDSISLNINGKWIAQGFPVKKKPQFIDVTLDPGPNTITFMADNLGSIIPNTSVLEIIDGNKRKAFYIETDLGQNNLIKIFYDFKPN